MVICEILLAIEQNLYNVPSRLNLEYIYKYVC